MSLRVCFIILNILMSLSVWGKDLELWNFCGYCKFPEQFLLKVDSLSSLSLISRNEANLCRSFAFHLQAKYTKSVAYADSVLLSKDISQSSPYYIRALLLKAESSLLTYKLVASSNLINEGLLDLKENYNPIYDANLKFLQGILMRRMGNIEESYNMIKASLDLLRKEDTPIIKLRMSHIMGTLVGYYIEDNHYSKAMDILQEREQILNTVEMNSSSAFVLDIERGYLYARMAFLSFHFGRSILANSYYEKFKSTGASSSPYSKVWINPYLLSIGEYEKVIENSDDYFIYTEMPDVHSSTYKRTLMESVSANQALKNYEWAFKLLQRYVNIQHEDMVDKERKLLYEMASHIDFLKDYYNPAHSDRTSALKKLFVALLSLLTVVGIAFAVCCSRKKRKKNARIMQLMLNMDKIRTEESVKNTEYSAASDVQIEDKEDVSSNEAIFSAFHTKVLEDKMYLDYQLQRDDYAEVMGVDRNRFASIIKEFTGGNLNSYLNSMRLEYSVTLLRTHPEMSIAEIGGASALPSSTTFYRLFKEKYGISPKAFRELIDSRS